MRNRVWILGLMLMALMALTGCQGPMSARGRAPTLTPILLPTLMKTPPPTRAILTATPTVAPSAPPSPAPATAPVIGEATTPPTPSPTFTPAPVQSTAAPASTSLPARPAATPLPGKIVFQAATGGDLRLLTTHGIRTLTTGLDPALSPDGKLLAFARWGEASGIYVLNLATGEERHVAAAQRPRSPSWRSDATRLVFARALGSTTCRQSPFGCLTDAELRVRLGGRDCLPTPTGLICITDFPVVELQRSGLTEIGVDGTEWADIPAAPDAQTPAWRPGTDEIVFLGGGRLQVTGRDQQPRPLTAEAWTQSPVWSPNGARMVAQRRIHDNWDLVLLDAAGNTLKVLTTTEANEVAPTWSPDGKQILFLSNADGAWRFYRMNANGGAATLLAQEGLRGINIRYDYASERVASWGS